VTHYNQSNTERIGDVNRGLLVETGDLLGTSYLKQEQVNLFTVYNRIIVHALWGEVVLNDLAGSGCLHQFNWTCTIPVVTVQPLCAVSTDIDGLVVGHRMTCPGDDSTTACAITASEGISYWPLQPMIIGNRESTAGVTSYGVIGELTTTVSLTGGSVRYAVLYTPLDDDAYVEALL